MNKTIALSSVVLGILFIIAAGIYVVTPAESLPTFMPGFQTAITTIHYKHAIGSFILALALFAFAWFKSAPKNLIKYEEK